MAAPANKLFVRTTDNISKEAATDIDTNKLLHYLDSNLDDFKIDASNTLKLYRFSSGYMNAPFLMKYGDQRYVLRRDSVLPTKDPTIMGLKQSSTLAKTYDIMKTIGENTSIPVPTMLTYCNDKSIIGCEFYVMKFIDGRIFYNTADTDTTSPGAPISKKDRCEMHDEIARILSDIHCVDVQKCGLLEIFQKYNTMQMLWTPSVIYESRVDGTKEFLKAQSGTNEAKRVEGYMNELKLRLKDIQNKSTNYCAQTVNGFEKQFGETLCDKLETDTESKTESDVIKKELDFLKAQLLENDLTLIHGDTQWENIIWHPTENKIIAMVDWEFCTIGNPCLEIAYNTIIWSFFAGLNMYHHKGVETITKEMINEEYMRHVRNMRYILNVYAMQLQSKNEKLYAKYIKDWSNGRIYQALQLWRLGSYFLEFHTTKETTEMGKALMEQFPIGLGPYIFDVGYRVMTEKSENKAIVIVDELLMTVDQFLSVEL